MTRRQILSAVMLAASFRLLNCTAAEPAAGWSSGLDLVVESAASARGGAARGQSLHSLALAKLEWRQEENADRNLQFHAYASALNLAGRGPSERFVGDLLAVSNIEGYPSTRLYSTWIEGRKDDWSLRAGSLLADEEFATTDGGANLQNSAFGWPAFISANTLNTGPAFFVPALGVRLERKFGETATWRAGLYDGDTFDSIAGDPGVNRRGVHFRFGGQQGWFAISEAAFTPKESDTRFKVGAWLHTAAFADVRSGASRSGNFGGYGAVERTLAGTAGETGFVTAFVRTGIAPTDRNLLSWVADTGVAIQGIIPGRKADVTTFGLVHASISPRFAAGARAAVPSTPAPDFEQVLELNYTAALSERFTLQPDLQYIRHPGGSSATRDALVALFRLKASF
jgi:porin